MLKRLKTTMAVILALSVLQSTIVLHESTKNQEIKDSFFTGQASAETLSAPIVVNHKSTGLSNFKNIPSNWIDTAKNKLVIAYEHTSHGSQLVTGMTDLVGFAGTQYSFSSDKETNKLELRDNPFGWNNLTEPDSSNWSEGTVTYLKEHPEVNVMMWSWCGGVSECSQTDINNYLNTMNSLENEFPNVKFVYMTGHLDGTGVNGNLNQRNEQIRTYVKSHNKILYDFADIESYDPDGNEFLSKNANDNCDYTGGNWCTQWQDKHVLGVDWFETSTAHSQSLNGNLKAYAAWSLFSRLAGWSGSTESQYFKVSYNGNGNGGGTVPVDNNKYIQNSKATILGNTGSLVKTGYVFAGWNTAANGNGTGYSAGTSVLINGADITLYAQWITISPAVGTFIKAAPANLTAIITAPNKTTNPVIGIYNGTTRLVAGTDHVIVPTTTGYTFTLYSSYLSKLTSNTVIILKFKNGSSLTYTVVLGATMSPTSGTFTKTAPANLTSVITAPNKVANPIIGVYNGTTRLVAGTDEAVIPTATGYTFTLYKSFLSKLTSNTVITLKFKDGSSLNYTVNLK
ncbi:MAG: InlB B-repeat-containing protein [Bacillota bacterium]|nr:InlB B-repeat-containing protein [Bacillota bacterium]